MNNLKFLAILLFSSVFLLSSCKDEDVKGDTDDNDETLLVGTWHFQEVRTGDELADALLNAFLQGLEYTFDSDGTFSIFILGESDTGTWTLQGSTLTLNADDGDLSSFDVRELSSTTMILFQSASVDEDGDAVPEYTWTFSKQ